MLDVALAIFVKTPGLSPVKTRLAAAIGEAAALRIYRRLLAVVADLGRRARRALPIQPYWAVAEAAAVGRWPRFPNVGQGEGSLGERMSAVADTLLARHPGVLLIGADAPDATIVHLAAALVALQRAPFVLGEALDGGFWLFGQRRSLPLPCWTAPRYSTAHAADDLRRQLVPLGSVARIATLHDLDTHEDLRALVAGPADASSAPRRRLQHGLRAALAGTANR